LTSAESGEVRRIFSGSASLRNLIEALQLTKRGLIAVAAALAALLGTGLVLAVTTEDVTQHNGMSTADPSRLRFFIDHRDALLIHAAKTVTMLGAVPVLTVLAVGAAGVLWWRGKPLVIAVAPVVSLVVAGGVASVAKTMVGRSRPPIGLRLVAETEPSFPSGHATDSAACYLALALVVAVFVLRRPLARVALVAGAAVTTALVGASRLELGVHWPTDVLAGWALGTTTAIAIVLVAVGLARLTPTQNRDAQAFWERVVTVLHARRSGWLHST
jgi:undecaprenyl-diphosphatase